jgi:transcriptional regulator with XRE-family HTH domain
MADDEWRMRLQEVVDKSGKSLRAISIKAGCSHGYLHGILNEDKEPTINRLVRLCAELDVSVIYIVLGIRWSTTQEPLARLVAELPDDQQKLLVDLATALARRG